MEILNIIFLFVLIGLGTWGIVFRYKWLEKQKK